MNRRLIKELKMPDFLTLSDRYLTYIGETLDDLGSEMPDFDCDYHSGILKFNIRDYRYVLNRMPPNKQIWWSSPLSGPLRFDFDGKVWFNKQNILLSNILCKEWNELTKQRVDVSKFIEDNLNK